MKWKDKLSRLTMPGAARPAHSEAAAASLGTLLSAQAEAELAARDSMTFEVVRDPDARTAEALQAEAELASCLDGTAELARSDQGRLPSAPPAEGRSERIDRLRAQLVSMQGRADRKPAEPLVLRAPVRQQASVQEDERAFVPPVAWRAGPLPGEVQETKLGPLRSVLTSHEEDHCHGSIPVALALESCARDLSVLALDPSLESVDFARALYIDTETTGLSGGSGTLPFLIGMAWFEGRKLQVEQLVLEKPGQEAPMLARFAERLRAASCIVSYNGKSFDWPLLRTRFILNRIPAPPMPAHLDLLHCARRVYKRRLGAVRLVHLEQHILGFTRVDDIPGELIPQTYLGFLRGTVPGGALVAIIDHNRHDLVALSAMLGEIVRRFRGGAEPQDARDQLGFAGVAARAKETERALSFARGAADADVLGELAPEALYLSGELKLRRGDYDGAAQAFVESLAASAPGSQHAARAHLALAKLYEHKLKLYDRARQHASHTAALEGEDGCQKRVARLSKRGAVTLSLF